jgi:hypothetical protein
MTPPQPTTDEQLQALRAEFEEYWLTCLQRVKMITIKADALSVAKDHCWRSWLHAKGVSDK